MSGLLFLPAVSGDRRKRTSGEDVEAPSGAEDESARGGKAERPRSEQTRAQRTRERRSSDAHESRAPERAATAQRARSYMAQNAMEAERRADSAGASDGLSQSKSGNALNGANADLLMNMMNCVDTSLFSPQQLSSWEQMKQRIKAAAEQNVPLVVPTAVTEQLKGASAGSSNGANGSDFRQPLHREASIQDVLSCLLDQQAPSLRVMASSGSNVLLNSEMKNRTVAAAQSEENRPTLKSLLSSNDFTMTEKKESLKHLLSFIDNSFASHPEPMTDVYKESQDGNLRRLSSLHLMRSFLTPNPNAQSMGRTTSFEIIQSMLNATSNQTIQKPMTSQDSFRFQHLANVLEAIEGDVGYDNEDYGGEVVQVDNLDNLLDYNPAHASQQSAATTSTTTTTSHHEATTGGFIDTQSMVNQANRMGGYSNDYASGGANGYQTYGHSLYGGAQYGAPQTMSHHSGLDIMGSVTGGLMYPPGAGVSVKVEPTTTHHHQMLPQDILQPPAPYGQMSFQSSMLASTTPEMLLASAGAQPSYHNPQTPGVIKHGHTSLQHQQYSAMLMQQQQQQMQQQAAMLQSTSHVKQQKQDVQGGVQICSALGCNHVARVKGMCKLHGGGRRCKVEGCMKSAQTGHLCIAHGGGKPCNVEGCPKTAQSRGLCKQHGGGVRCKFEGCTKSCQSGGYCRGHGGGKRCEFPNCTKWAQKNGHCAKHAQEIAQHVHP